MSAEREVVSGEALEQMIELLAVSRADGQAARCVMCLHAWVLAIRNVSLTLLESQAESLVDSLAH